MFDPTIMAGIHIVATGTKKSLRLQEPTCGFYKKFSPDHALHRIELKSFQPYLKESISTGQKVFRD